MDKRAGPLWFSPFLLLDQFFFEKLSEMRRDTDLRLVFAGNNRIRFWGAAFHC